MKQYGLIGYPLSHSFSRKFFNDKFRTERIDASYENFEIETISLLPRILEENPELTGLNVTIPYKEQVMAYLDEIEESARTIGAVNTIKIVNHKEKKLLKGFNTDTWGFENSVKPLMKDYHKKALILGTGGASKAVKYVFNKLGINHISASTSSIGLGDEDKISYKDIDRKLMEECLLIINTTPLGTFPKTETCPSIPYEFIGSRHVLFDLVYNPPTTRFLTLGKENGAVIKNGYEMLLGQALKSYEIWEQ